MELRLIVVLSAIIAGLLLVAGCAHLDRELVGLTGERPHRQAVVDRLVADPTGPEQRPMTLQRAVVGETRWRV
jgi:hypothetical protein